MAGQEKPPFRSVDNNASPTIEKAVSRSFLFGYFVLGVILFAAIMASLVFWFGRPTNSQAHATGDLFALPSETTRLTTVANSNPDRAYTQPESKEIRVLFTADGLTLTPQVLKLSKSLDAQARLRFAITELLRGPSTEILSSVLPSGVEALGVFIVGDTAVIDLSDELRKHPLGGPTAEMLCVYAIVDTVLENVDTVSQVRILIQGRSVDTLWGEIDLTAPFSANLALLRQ